MSRKVLEKLKKQVEGKGFEAVDHCRKHGRQEQSDSLLQISGRKVAGTQQKRGSGYRRKWWSGPENTIQAGGCGRGREKSAMWDSHSSGKIKSSRQISCGSG